MPQDAAGALVEVLDLEPIEVNGRGLARGLVFTRSGTLVATVMQERLTRSAR